MAAAPCHLYKMMVMLIVVIVMVQIVMVMVMVMVMVNPRKVVEFEPMSR